MSGVLPVTCLKQPHMRLAVMKVKSNFMGQPGNL